MARDRKYVSWRGMAAGAVMMLILFGVGMYLVRADLKELQAQDNHLQLQVELMQLDRDDLKQQLARVGSDGYVENQARQNYGYTKENEIIFAFEDPSVLRGYTEEEYQIIMDEMRD